MTRPDLLTKEQLLERHNRILFGAPGTGKSYYLNVNSKKDVNGKKIFDENNIERVTFYPRYSYGQFVGMYKPVPSGDAVTYRYVPGPFMRTYVKAKNAIKAHIIYEEYEEDKKTNFSNRNFFFLSSDPDKVWNLFDEIKFESDEVSFEGTKAMKKGDIGLIYLKEGKVVKEKGEGSGIYAVGRIIKDVETTDVVLKKKNTEPTRIIWLRVDKIYNNSPLIKADNLKEIKNKQTPNKISDELKNRIIDAFKKDKFGNENNNNYLLLIEELNRANAASVFGDVFQLLDRKEGKSIYPITTSEESREYLAKEFYGRNYEDCTPEQRKECETMCIPSNMYIWSTMNSADQGVEVLDTAFKRRWEFEYIGINEGSNSDEFTKYKIPVGDSKHRSVVNWDKLRQEINKILSERCHVKEDKLLGPYFITKEKLDSVNKSYNKGNKDEKSEDEFVEGFKGKVLMYLFEDAAAGNLGALFNNCDHFRYSDVCDAFDRQGVEIFGPNFKERVIINDETQVNVVDSKS